MIIYQNIRLSLVSGFPFFQSVMQKNFKNCIISKFLVGIISFFDSKNIQLRTVHFERFVLLRKIGRKRKINLAGNLIGEFSSPTLFQKIQVSLKSTSKRSKRLSHEVKICIAYGENVSHDVSKPGKGTYINKQIELTARTELDANKAFAFLLVRTIN